MKWIVCLLPAFALAQKAVDPPDPRELVKQSADAVKPYKSYQLESTVMIEMEGGPIHQKLVMPSGVWVRRPDKIRIESVNQEDEVVIIGDGQHTWFYVSNARKFVKRDAVQSPEAAVISSGLLPKNLPDLNQFIKSVKNTGEDAIEIDGVSTPCYVIQTLYDSINLPEQNITITDGVQLSWISKDKKLTLQSSFGGKIRLPGFDEPIQMTQSTLTTKVLLNPDLEDSLFEFTPPEGVTEAEDWTLPGLTKPDVVGSPAPPGLAPDAKGKVVLAYFIASPCAPCQPDLAVIEKLKIEFRDQGLVVLTGSGDFPQLAITSWPTMVLIDRDGKIAAYEVGTRGEQKLRDDLKKAGIAAKTP